MGTALVGAAISIGKSLFKKKAKKVATTALTRVANSPGLDLETSAGPAIDAARNLGRWFGGTSLGQRAFGGGGTNLPAIPPASFGGGTNLPAVIPQVITALAGGGTAIQRHPGAVALPDGTIWWKGHLYVYRQTASGGRMQRVIRDRRTGQIVPAPKSMNVLNPHALSRSMRRVEGFHRVASSAIKHMEKWARKTQRRKAPSRAVAKTRK